MITGYFIKSIQFIKSPENPNQLSYNQIFATNKHIRNGISLNLFCAISSSILRIIGQNLFIFFTWIGELSQESM